MNNKQYKISVIIPVYNVEEYVEETLISVIKQDIGFEKNIQIILVNDGSTDNSEQICLKYAEKYPQNIKYIKQKNAGVSAARNYGLKYATGKYVNFLDSDDTWEKNVFRKAYNFLEKHQDEIDMVACRQRFFGKVNGFKHALDYKFECDEVVDIKSDYQKIQLSIASMFIKNSLLKGKEFDTDLKYAEDAKLISELITEKEKYGILKTAIYNYRRRENNGSAIQTGPTRKEWYNDTVERCYKEIFEYSKKVYGKVIPYYQYQIMYDLQWRLSMPISASLTEDEKKRYIYGIKELLQDIDDNIILEQKRISAEVKLYALRLKYNEDIQRHLQYKDEEIFIKELPIENLFKKLLTIKILEIEKGCLQLEGIINNVLDSKEYEIYFKDDKGKRYDLELYEMVHYRKNAMDGHILDLTGFKVKIPLKDIKNLKAIFHYKNNGEVILNPRFEAYSKLNLRYRYSYYTKGKYLITSKNKLIKVEKNSIPNHIKSEILYMLQLLKHKKLIGLSYRALYYITGIFYRKPIWIVSDRPDMADDNGLHMFKYLIKNEKNAKIYFAISKKSRDYEKVKKIGKILELESIKYKMKLMHSSKVISSQANEYVINASKKGKQFIKDLYKFDFVFLQHGIIKDDLSEWLHKHNKNIKMFVTSSPREYDSIINGKYDYDSSVVKLTGLPRYDSLMNEKNVKKQILFMPTWRKSLAGREINSLGEREYNEEFKNSEYCKFYNKLINDKRILDKLKEKGFTGRFFVHPTLKEQSSDFIGNEYIKICNVVKDYQKEFKENSILVTDYSSVAFDFAYLKKPIIYTQFDKDYFYDLQLYDKGYFNYETDGLGPICYDHETTVKTIIEYIENGGKLKNEYENRINAFYYKFDTKNCERVYKEILKLDEEHRVE